VDYDPVVLAHARALLASHPAGATDYIHADLRDTPAILAQAGELLDFTEPVAVMLLAILQAIPESDEPHQIVATLMDSVPAGSYLVISHVASDLLGGETTDDLTNVTKRMVQQQLISRGREEVARFFAGTDLVEPGLVPAEEWRPDAGSPAGKSALLCGAGRKR
jgi:hypothetical protein